MSRNPGDAVYGTITIGALLAAETARAETYAETIAAVALALALYWLAHAYASLTAQRWDDGTKLTAHALRKELVHELPLLAGGAVPLLVVLIAWISGTGLASALTAGVIAAAVTVLMIELVAAWRAELKGWELLVQASGGAALGCAVIALKAILH